MKRRYLFGLVFALLALGLMYQAALVDPIRRDLYYASPRWPAGAPPVRLVFLSDLHAGLPDMPPERIARLVTRVNALKPDCVLIAGDFTSDKLSGRPIDTARAVAPLAKLRPRIETIAVLGNHDEPRGRAQMIVALADVGLHVVSNGAARCGPLAIGGVDEIYFGHADVAQTLLAMQRIGGVPLLISHSPDAFPLVKGVGLTLAGHTHCGQIVPPLIGPLTTSSWYGRRFTCGIVRERGMTMVVSAGIGTSIAPFRWNAHPDFWVVTAGPARGS